jgi:hypothetical protein
MSGEALPNSAPAPRQSTDRASGRPSLVVITVLLILILLAQLYQAYTTWQRSMVHAQKVEAVRDIVDKQQTLILGLLDSYHKDAYENESLERISEQQLVASEYTLTALQIIGVQNTQIIELLSDVP